MIAVAITPDGSTVVSGSRDRTIKVWDLSTAKEVMKFVVENTVSSFAISPDCQTILAGEVSGIVHFLRIEGLTIDNDKIYEKLKKS